MMGGGFGGCTINLIEPASVDEISAIVSARYKTAFDREPKIYCTHIGPGTAIVGKETDENI
jgi:galactokinase